MQPTEAAAILRGDMSPSSVLHPQIAAEMGAQALEAWGWVEREKATVQPLGAGWNAEMLDDDGRWVIGTGPTPLLAVLDAMEKEKGNG
jgi:hypothetical protein